VLNEITERRQQDFERTVQRMQELNTVSQQSTQGVDVRTQAGADLVLNLELARQDPRLIEARLQTKVLQQVRDAVIENIVRNVSTPTAIVGMARLN
jgi:maleate cis-trans isomerase